MTDKPNGTKTRKKALPITLTDELSKNSKQTWSLQLMRMKSEGPGYCKVWWSDAN